MTQARASAFGELDIWLARAGRHEELWAKLGAHPVEGGVRFAVWAPNADRSASSVTSTPGAPPRTRCSRWPRPGSGRESSTAPRPGSTTSTTSTAARRPTRSRSRRRCRRRRRRSCTRRRTCGRTRTGSRSAGPARSSNGRFRSTSCMRRRGAPGLGWRELAHELGDVRARSRLHPCRADAGDAPPVLGLLGLPGHRLLRAARVDGVARRLPLLRRPSARRGSA